MNPLKLPKNLKSLPHWRNFAKSGHTEEEEVVGIVLNYFRNVQFRLMECNVFNVY